jgi:hypothetical protein
MARYLAQSKYSALDMFYLRMPKTHYRRACFLVQTFHIRPISSTLHHLSSARVYYSSFVLSTLLMMFSNNLRHTSSTLSCHWQRLSAHKFWCQTFFYGSIEGYECTSGRCMSVFYLLLSPLLCLWFRWSPWLLKFLILYLCFHQALQSICS